jgi:nucleoid DNA-binding protein
MVGRVIRDYMEGGAKKLTVPGFGTFLRREGGDGNARGEVIFVDLLRGDDHTLSELVEDSGQYSEVEAMALIDRFIFETKTAIERGGSATIEGFGVMTLDHKGLYRFNYSPKKRLVKEHAVQERLFETPASRTPVSRTPASGAHSGAHSEVRRPRPVVPQNSEPDAPRRPEPVQARGRVASKAAPNRNSRLTRSDLFVVIAIVAAAIALVAMIFGMWTGNMSFSK